MTLGNEIRVSDFSPLANIGVGQYGMVFSTHHMPTQTKVAIKKVISTKEQYKEFRKFWSNLFNLNPLRDDDGRQFIVDFFGTLLFDSDCWICMELMDLSVDKLLKFVYSPLTPSLHHFVPEYVVAQIARSMTSALCYLDSYKTRRKACTSSAEIKNSKPGRKTVSVPFADVKSSNVLINRSGRIKLSDLGMYRRLIDPSASIHGGDWYHYVAPERITSAPNFENSKSDVWSLGISIFEIACGHLPYNDAQFAFHVIAAIAEDPSPRLEQVEGRISSEMVDFVNACLEKQVEERASLTNLQKTRFLILAEQNFELDKIAGYFDKMLDLITNHQDDVVAEEAEKRRLALQNRKAYRTRFKNGTADRPKLAISASCE